MNNSSLICPDTIQTETGPIQFQSMETLTTERTCKLFSSLYHAGYFRKRHRLKKKDLLYHADLPLFLSGKQLESFYNGHNTTTLKQKLSHVDRRIFYKHVVSEIAGDGSVYDVVRWVSQNVASSNFVPTYDELDLNAQVKDGIEIMFIGYGKCGQINRLLGFLLKHGMGEDIKFVSTSGHAFVEWYPKNGTPKILDADFFKNGNANVSVQDLIDGKTINSMTNNYHQIESTSAYMQITKGPAVYYYNDLELTEDGTKILEDISSSMVNPKIIEYVSLGHKVISFKKARLIDGGHKHLVELAYTAQNLDCYLELHLYFVKMTDKEQYSSEVLATNQWSNDVVLHVSTMINPRKLSKTIPLNEKLPDGDYAIILAVSSGYGLWGFHVAYGDECGTF